MTSSPDLPGPYPSREHTTAVGYSPPTVDREDSGMTVASPTEESGAGDGGVKEKASDVAQAATQSGKDVTGEAADHVKDVASEARRQARDLAGEARTQVSNQADSQQQSAAKQLRGLSDQLRSMAERGEQSGLATELAHQASDQTSSAAHWLEQHQPGDLLNEVRDFARRRPGAFLVGALVAGVVAGRLTRGLTATGSSSNGDSDAPRSAADLSSAAGTRVSTPDPSSTYSGTTTYATSEFANPADAGVPAADSLLTDSSAPPDPYLTSLTTNEDIQHAAGDLHGQVRP